VNLDECVLAGHGGQHAVGDQPPVRLVPPYAVRGLLKLALLQEVEDSKHEQSRSRQGHQRSLHAIEEAFVHKREGSYTVNACTSVATQGRRADRPVTEGQSFESTRDMDSKFRQTSRKCEPNHDIRLRNPEVTSRERDIHMINGRLLIYSRLLCISK
jgi:hypothetical protein